MDILTQDDLETARSVIRIEREALEILEKSIDSRFSEAVNLIANCSGYTIVTGMGKSGHIGQKIAASLASTGTPSFFVHPTEASHGDLGMIAEGSVVIAISYSGESRELVDLLRYCNSKKIPVIALTRAPESTLGRMSTLVLDVPPMKEACPNGLAPTTSTTMSLALGDALTIATMERRGFSREDFGLRHPGGKLGRQLHTVEDYLMTHAAPVPTITPDTEVPDVILAISAGRNGCVAVCGEDGKMLGMITDGDLRRAILAKHLDGTAEKIMSASPHFVSNTDRMSTVVQLLTEERISNCFVLDDGKPTGVIHIKNLLAEGYL